MLYSFRQILPGVFLGNIVRSLRLCEVIATTREADDAVAAIAKERNAFGIMSDDSDFICFQVYNLITYN